MPTTAPRRSLDELAKLGGEIFDHRIQPTLQPSDHGKYVAIDVESGEFEMDVDDYAAVSRLRARIPGADIWLMCAGFPTAYTIGAARFI